MKILIIQENGRHDENRVFRECHSLKRALDKLNIETVVWGAGHDNFSTPFEEIVKNVDVIILLENYDTGWVPNLSNINKLKLFWSIDSHCILESHQHTVKENKINIVLNSIESHQSYFNDCKTYYFPNAYSSDLIKPINNVEKDVFLGFCGTYFNERKWLIEEVIEPKLNLLVQKDIWCLGDCMVKSINSYKIHLNKTISNDINYRVFETMGCNTLLLTNNTENITHFFKDMEDIVIYNNTDDLIDKINYLKNNENSINTVSKNGYENVIKNHTFDKRAEELISILKNNI